VLRKETIERNKLKQKSKAQKKGETVGKKGTLGGGCRNDGSGKFKARNRAITLLEPRKIRWERDKEEN